MWPHQRNGLYVNPKGIQGEMRIQVECEISLKHCELPEQMKELDQERIQDQKFSFSVPFPEGVTNFQKFEIPGWRGFEFHKHEIVAFDE